MAVAVTRRMMSSASTSFGSATVSTRTSFAAVVGEGFHGFLREARATCRAMPRVGNPRARRVRQPAGRYLRELGDQRFARERLDDEVGGARFHAAHQRVEARLAGQHDDRDRGELGRGLDLLGERDAVVAGQHDVHDDEVGPDRADALDRRARRRPRTPGRPAPIRASPRPACAGPRRPRRPAPPAGAALRPAHSPARRRAPARRCARPGARSPPAGPASTGTGKC